MPAWELHAWVGSWLVGMNGIDWSTRGDIVGYE